MAKASFDIEVLHQSFTKCLEGDMLLLEPYLMAFRELCKFFEVLGSAFGFVSSDLHEKINILENHRIGDCSHHFSSFDKMIKYEMSDGLTSKKEYVSGARTLLRLHRALAFIEQFLSKMMTIEMHVKTVYIGHEAYESTLANYHPWIIRKAVKLAMYTLPTKQDLASRISGNDMSVQQKLLEVLPKVIITTRAVYDKTQLLYEEHDLLQLA